jgi:hypothetical protein
LPARPPCSLATHTSPIPGRTSPMLAARWPASAPRLPPAARHGMCRRTLR